MQIHEIGGRVKMPDTKHGVLRIRSDRAQNVRLCFGRVAGAYGGAVHDPLDL